LWLIEGKHRAKNMGFLVGWHMKLGSAQTVAHFCFMTFILTAFLLPTRGFNYGDSMFILLIMVTRSFIIGVRYGFMSTVRYNMMGKQFAQFDWLTNDFLFMGWLRLSPKTLKEEINAAKFRTQVIEEEFTFTFVQDLPEELAEKFEKEDYYDLNKFNSKDMKSKVSVQKSVLFKQRREDGGTLIDEEFGIIHDIEEGKPNRRRMLSHLDSQVSESCKSVQYVKKPKIAYKGDTILREMALLESALNVSVKPLVFIVFIRVFLPLFVQFYDNDFKFVMFWYEYIMVFCNIVIIILIYGVNLTFIYAGIIDFRRKLFLMKLLHSMISPEKDKYFAFSTYFPTLNICDTKNLNSWMLLRAMCLDLGKKYTYRIFVYCSVFMAFYLTFFVFLVLSFLGILNYKLPLIVYITGTYDITVILGIFLIMIRMGAQVNNYSEKHKGVFINLKRQFWDAKNHYHALMAKKLDRNPNQKVFRDLLKQMRLDPLRRDNYFDECMALVDIISENLDYNRQTRPLKLMGLTASDELLTSIYTAIVSVIFAMSQIFYSSLTEGAEV